MNPDYLMTAFYAQAGTFLGAVLYMAGRVFYSRKRTKK